MTEVIDRSRGAISTKAQKMGLAQQHLKPNDAYADAKPYQEYDWCYQRYVIQRKTHKEMADEAGVKVRTIQKWCSDIHRLNEFTLKDMLRLTPEQRQIIIWGTLGDGHIDRREDVPLYIESHAENQKDYLFWKYDKLKNLCNKPPRYIEPCVKMFKGKSYMIQGAYRFQTKIITELKQIRNMTKIEKIDTIDNLGLCLLILDDGYRDKSAWELCVASFTNDEKQYLQKKCMEVLGLQSKIMTDDRYIRFPSEDSKLIDKMMFELFGKEMDIIQYKILQKGIKYEPIQ